MQSVLANALVSETEKVIAVGKDTNLHNNEGSALIQEAYFAIGSIVIANVAYIAASLDMMAALRRSYQYREPTIDELKDQIRKMKGEDEQPVGSAVRQDHTTPRND